jgi:Carboxypeptidase regulatory-like domain
MKSAYKLAGMLTALLLVVAGLFSLSSNVSAAGEGKITGTVKLNGTPPHEKTIDMSKDPVCQKAHTGNPAKVETVVAGSSGGLQNVVVYISEGMSGGAAATTPVTIDQHGCMYVPHVVALDVNEPMRVTNSDQTTHNIHPLPTPGSGNTGWNKSQPPGSAPFDVTWKAQEIAIPVKCNIHPWMHGFIAVVKGPYGTSDQNGSYTIDNVPPGSYTLTAWHEDLGTQTAKVTVAAGKPGTADFTFKAK